MSQRLMPCIVDSRELVLHGGCQEESLDVSSSKFAMENWDSTSSSKKEGITLKKPLEIR